MLTDDGLASLRMAATLALTLPTVQVRIASPTRVLAEVGWHFETVHSGDTPQPPGLGEGVRLRPCAFRVAVGRAWNQRKEGLDVDFCGLGDAEPIISVEVAPGERVLPGDIYQVRAESGGWHHVLPTLLPPEGCHAVLGLDGPPLSFHDDPVTGVTLVHTETDSPDLDRLPHLVAHLTALRGRLLAEELIADPLVVR
ncbi:MAG: hypothetical protein ACRDYF_14475 [Acidimicrobiia bacterium]